MKRLVILFLLIGGIYAGFLVFLYFYQARLIFYPSFPTNGQKLSFNGDFSENFLTLGSGDTVHFLEFKVENPKRAILYFHGNAGDLSGWGHVAAEMAEKTSSDVWIMDYPGFGKSSPELPKNERVLLEMGSALIERIRAVRPGLPLYLYGRSIGSGIASTLAQTPEIEGLVLETPYTSLRDLAKSLYPFVPSALLRYDLDNTRLAKSAEPRSILILHGTKDEVIPFRMGERLAVMLTDRPEGRGVNFMPIEGGRHNDLTEFSEYWGRLQVFFMTHANQR